MRARQTALALLAAVLLHARVLRGEDVLCVSGEGQGGGGLANTLAFANAVFDFALRHNATFLSFPLHVHVHNDGTPDEALASILLALESRDDTAMVDVNTSVLPASAWHCPDGPVAAATVRTHAIPSVQSSSKRCGIASLRARIGGGSVPVHTDQKRSFIDTHVDGGPTAAGDAHAAVRLGELPVRWTELVPSHSTGATSPHPRCAMLILVPLAHIRWHFNYTLTGPALQASYRSALVAAPPPVLSSLAGPSKVAVAIHFRLGDVRSLRHGGGPGIAEKRMAATWPALGLAAVLRVVHGACLHPLLLTDGTDTHANATVAAITALLAGAEAGHVDFPAIQMAPYNTVDALHVLAGAPILIASASGFSRLAAVLSQGVVLAPHVPSHPLSFPVITVPADTRLWQWWDSSPGALRSLLDAHLHTILASLRPALTTALSPRLPAWCLLDS